MAPKFVKAPVLFEVELDVGQREEVSCDTSPGGGFRAQAWCDPRGSGWFLSTTRLQAVDDVGRASCSL